jgi:hypothetical protein
VPESTPPEGLDMVPMTYHVECARCRLEGALLRTEHPRGGGEDVSLPVLAEQNTGLRRRGA